MIFKGFMCDCEVASDRLTHWMIVAPSPSQLIHSNYRNNNVTMTQQESAEILSSAFQKLNQSKKTFVDLGFRCLSKDASRRYSQIFNAALLLTTIDEFKNPQFEEFIGIICKKYHNYQTALKFFIDSASHGSVSSLLHIGLLYFHFPQSFPYTTNQCYDIAAVWFLRAMNRGSTDALLHIAKVLYTKNKLFPCLSFYAKYYALSKCVSSAQSIASLLVEIKYKSEADRLHRFAAINGSRYSAEYLVHVNEEVWKPVVDRFSKRVPGQRFILPKFFQCSMVFNWEIPSLSGASRHLDNLLRAKIVPQSSCETKREINQQNNTKESKILNFYPSFEPMKVLLLAFEYASPDISQRNLVMVAHYLKQLSTLEPRGLTAFPLWSEKCETGSANELVRCGFISYFFNYSECYEMFFNAYQSGSLVGAQMVGILTYHGLGRLRDPTQGCLFLAKCSIDPLSLIHLGLTFEDQEYLRRAASLLHCEDNIGFLYEWAGDMFANGIHMIRSTNVAIIFYGLALKQYEEDFKDVNTIRKKIARIMF